MKARSQNKLARPARPAPRNSANGGKLQKARSAGGGERAAEKQKVGRELAAEKQRVGEELAVERQRVEEELDEQKRRLAEELILERQQLEVEHRAVTETQESLESSLDHYVDLFDFAPIGFVTLDVSGVIRNINLSGARLLHYDRRFLIGKPLLALVLQADRKKYMKYLGRIRMGNGEERIDLAFRGQPDPMIFEIVSTISTGRSGYFRIRMAFRDVSRQRHAEAAQLHLAAIVEHSDDAIVGKDLDGMITSWNRGAVNLFGYTAEEAIGRPVFHLIPRERHDEEIEMLRQIQGHESVAHCETIWYRKDGSAVPISLTVSPIKDVDGRVISASAIARDISKRREVEEALRRVRDELEQRVRDRTDELTKANADLENEVRAHEKAEEALRQSEAHLQSILDNSPEMIFLKDVAGRYLLYNRRFGQAFGLRDGKAIGKTDSEIFAGEQARAFRENDLKVIETGGPIQFEEAALHKDGRHVSIVSKFPIQDNEGRIYAIGGIVTDITERRRLEQEVLRISEHEQQRIAQDLHDGLGQQLAGTWFLSDTLRKTLEARSADEVQIAAKIAQLLDNAVGQIRGLARGLSPVPAQPEGLMSALQALAAQCSELFHINCRFVCGSPVLIRNNEIATNLYRIAQEAINNAIKHGRARKVEIGLFAIKGQPSLTVIDDGTGFKESVNGQKGMGLRTMSYRAEVIGADFAIRKRKSKGTEVTCRVRNR